MIINSRGLQLHYKRKTKSGLKVMGYTDYGFTRHKRGHFITMDIPVTMVKYDRELYYAVNNTRRPPMVRPFAPFADTLIYTI